MGHAIPTAALALEFQRAGNEVAMITDSGGLAAFYGRLGLRCIDIQAQNTTATEALAMMLSVLMDFDPDITVTDWRRDLWLTQEVAPPRCRISILRCEHFAGYVRRSPFLPSQHIKYVNTEEEKRFLRLFKRPAPADRRPSFGTEVVVGPSTPEFDPPPANL